ncbi:DEAD/DEAH box helicase family protein [Pseudanabaena sp. FACHB-1277]|uniref:DEAD/DEAH box helicase family protein n=1 Tax=Pseudanabaena cinerea FACHB-1277 TaxID=2949581 RepID=A0A926UVF3_9CYAN|nr:DEAD/DEAH box helicase family protein [Pseudanabaena cinerea]MBD2150747.1 DEAD/DEAH box helicase family protein [Pseudanabaena cinerea FACHB-1277]
MTNNEATVRIKINKLLESSGWRFFAEGGQPANIVLEAGTQITSWDLDEFWEDFGKTRKGFIDFLLLNEKGSPFIVLEAKAGNLDPLVGKEQARDYAKSQKCRFVILSNGNKHYFWGLEQGNPYEITSFPTPQSVIGYQKVIADPQRLVDEVIDDDYVVLTQYPDYENDAGWKNELERASFIEKNKLRFLRSYQKQAIAALQGAVQAGKDRFLFQMATGTGKTLTSAAVIKLFLKTGNARRVLFLVDRIELEEQAKKAFDLLLKNDYKTVIYKENRNDWRLADIVVTTVQSLLTGNKYRDRFSPTDFDLVISDEAHRSIGGNARAVFDYFIGYKLGLTATPKDYLKQFDRAKPTTKDPREYERRIMLDTYRTFGCADGIPTFSYGLNDGVRDGFLIQPTVVDGRTEVTTELLSKDGFLVEFTDEEGEKTEESFKIRQFEKRFFSSATNQLFCKTFLEKAFRDPISGEIGKSIIFAVSQPHALKLTEILNEMADRIFPNRYNSDFAVQVTSQITDAQLFTSNFTNNNLRGTANFLETYRTSKARVCVTVGMMTTGYDCPDLLNLGLFRPIFSPTDFIQIKGRGTRRHNFLTDLHDQDLKATVKHPEKTAFKLFDFFANCEYFEKDFKYDEVLALPKPKAETGGGDGGTGGGTGGINSYEHLGADIITSLKEEAIAYGGMKIDRLYFERFEEVIRNDRELAAAIEVGHWEKAIAYVNEKFFADSEQAYTLEKLRKAAAVDRRLEVREILEKIFGLIPRFKLKDELLEEEFEKFVANYQPDESIPAIKSYFKAYVTNDQIRKIIEAKNYAELATNAFLSLDSFKAVPKSYRNLIPEYVREFVVLERFVS